MGVVLHATGDMRNSFTLEIKRSHDLESTLSQPMKRISLQWVDARHFDVEARPNYGKHEIDDKPVCGFEASAQKAKAPGETLNAVGGQVGLTLAAFSTRPEPGRAPL